MLSVYNPNGYRLDATQLTYRVNLAGDSITVADGTMSNRFTVQDNDSTVVTIPVNFSYAGIGAAGRSILNNGAVDYHVLGNVTVGSPVGYRHGAVLVDRPVHDDGTGPLTQLE